MVLGRLRPGDLADRSPLDRTFRPDPAAARLLHRRHQQFIGLHRSQKGLYHALNRVRRSRS
jgi:hypothetical protein